MELRDRRTLEEKRKYHREYYQKHKESMEYKIGE